MKKRSKPARRTTTRYWVTILDQNDNFVKSILVHGFDIADARRQGRSYTRGLKLKTFLAAS